MSRRHCVAPLTGLYNHTFSNLKFECDTPVSSVFARVEKEFCNRSLLDLLVVSPPLQSVNVGFNYGLPWPLTPMIPLPGVLSLPFPHTFLAVAIVTGWECRRMDGRQESAVWWLRICTALRVRPGRMVTNFGYDR
jgi:hypothetical protein